MIPHVVVIGRVSGRVVIDLDIAPDGAVISTRFVEGHSLLRKATEEALLRWRFARSNVSRKLRLTFVYPVIEPRKTLSVLVLPYRMELESKFEAPPDTVSYIPSDFEEGKTRCEVHGDLLHKDKVEIAYGLVGFKVGYIEAQEKLFPNSNKLYYGGCVITDESPKYAEVLYCPKCRRAESKWSKAH